MKLEDVNLREYIVKNDAGLDTLDLDRLVEDGVPEDEVQHDWDLNMERIGEALDKAGLSWCQCKGYCGEPFCDGGGWGSDDPYPFKTSDGKTEKSLYTEDETDKALFAKEQEELGKNPAKAHRFRLDEDGRLYDMSKYPKPDDYDIWFVMHVKT